MVALSVGGNSGGSGDYELDAGTLTTTSNEQIGHGGTGVFNQLGGTHNATSSKWVRPRPASGTYNLQAGNLM